MKVTLINPPFSVKCMRDFRCQGAVEADFVGEVMPPLALTYVAAVLREKGHKIDLIDCIAEELGLNELIERIKQNTPELLVSVVATSTIESDLFTVSEIKKALPEIKTGLFGTHVNVFPKETLENDFVDFVVTGEAEYPILELVTNLQNKKQLSRIKSLGWKNSKGKITVNERASLIKNLDKLPFPARDLLPIAKYRGFLIRKKPFTTVLTSRGCTAGCLFCGSQIMLERKWRPRSPENVVKELEILVKDFGIKEVFFNDDCFTMSKERVKKICKLMKEKNINLFWGCESRVNTVDLETLKAMKAVGCYKIAYGLESGNQEILDKMKKGATLEQARNAIKWTKEAGIYANGSFIIGVPWDNEETIKQTTDFAIELDLDHVQFLISTPFPGTEFYDIAIKYDLLVKGKGWDKFQLYRQSVAKSLYLSHKEIETLRLGAYKKFYMRPSYVIKRLWKVRSMEEFFLLVNTAFSLLKSSQKV